MYKEEKSSCHVAMVAKFLDDNKPKRHLKVDSYCFKLHRSHLISFNLSNVGEIFWLNPKGRYVSLEKETQNFCVVLTNSIKRAREIRKFYVAVVPQQLRNVQQSVMHVQRCFFANLNLLLLCCLPSPLQKLPIVVTQKFCYHGNVTSHFFSLLNIKLIFS